MHGWDEETQRRAKHSQMFQVCRYLKNYLFQWRFMLPVWLLVICEIEWHIVLVSWTGCQTPHPKVITTFFVPLWHFLF